MVGGLGGAMVLFGGFGGHKTSALVSRCVADVVAHRGELAAGVVLGGKIVDGHGVAVMEKPGTGVNGVGGAVVPNKYGSSVAGSVAERIVVAMDDYHRQLWRRDAARGGGHHPGEDAG